MKSDSYPRFFVFDGYRIEGTQGAQAKLVAKLSASERIEAFVNASQLLQPTECVRKLFESGLVGVDGTVAKKMMTEALQSRKTVRKTIVTRNGWHGGDYAKLGQCLYKAEEKSDWCVLRRPREANGPNPTGNEELIDMLEQLFPKSSYLAFAIMVAFSGPVLEIAGEHEGIIFYFCGETSTGKTTLIQVIQALTYDINHRKLAPFHFTSSGIEDIAYAANDSVFCVDEIGTMPETEADKMMRQFVYKIANGGGKRRSRSSAVQEQYPELDWRTICALTGEINLAATLQSARSGIDARFVQVNVPAAIDGGIFDRCRQQSDANAAIIDRLKVACMAYTGHVNSRWLRFLVELSEDQKRNYRLRVGSLTRELSGPHADNLQVRRARKLAVVALTGEMLGDAGLFDWQGRSPEKIVKRIYGSLAAGDGPHHSELEFTRWLGRVLLASYDSEGGAIESSVQIVTKGGRRLIEIPKDSIASVSGDLSLKSLLIWLDRNRCVHRTSKKRTSAFSQVRENGVSRPVLYLDVDSSKRLFDDPTN